MSDRDRDPADSFARLLGRQPGDAERQQLYRVRDALGLKGNDALWLVLIALQHYQTQYEKFPHAIAQSAKAALADFKVAADATAQAAAQSAQADLAQAVATAARETAQRVAGRQRAQWIAASIVAASAVFALFGWFMHSSGSSAGNAAGRAAGYAEARDEKAAAAWANTPEGREAYRLAQAGSIGPLIRCNYPGWRIEKGFCYVRPTADGNVYGWRLP